MFDSRHSGLGMTFLTGAMMLLLIAITDSCFVPMVECPLLAADVSKAIQRCPNWRMPRNKQSDGLVEMGWEKGCPICRGRGKVSLLSRWIHRNIATP